jgi:histone deacetylase HOS2
MVYPTGDIVQEFGILPLGPRDDAQNARFLAQVKNQILTSGIQRPKGYNVSWHSNPEIEKHHFGYTHPMKPWRLTLAKSLIVSYGMHAAMDTYVSRRATIEEMQDFHSQDYLEYLSTAIPSIPDDDVLKDYNLGSSDCPVFQGLFNYCSMYCGASIDAARKLNNNESDIAVNWSGGLHHAKKAEAAGFCYANDIVLAILQLLRKHPRVLYIDIDVHHGDGVEEAFWSTDRVLTVSFHKYDGMNFFPGTGDLDRTGPDNNSNPGAHHSVNVPLSDGIGDKQYTELFEAVISKCVEHFRPSAVVLQCGADSLAGDRLGRFNVQVKGHGACVTFCKNLNLPLLLVGGGGYTPRNVARAWAHETSLAIGAENIDPIIPLYTPHREHFRHDGSLFPTLEEVVPNQLPNKNTPKKLEEIVRSVHEHLRFVSAAPSVQSMHIPPDLTGFNEEVEQMLKEEREEIDDDLRQSKEENLGYRMEY